jgi:hypothetical protein
MSHTWIQIVDGSLLRADDIRQINVADGLHAVLASGGVALVADVEDRADCVALAKDLAAAMAGAHPSETAMAISVERTVEGWSVNIEPLHGRP